MLALYRRHRQNCKGDHPHNTRSSEYDERKKGWKRCECPIFASGTLDKIAKRQNTGKWEWESARAITAEWDAAGSWMTRRTPPAPISTALVPLAPDRVTIADATESFIASCQNRGIATPTLKKYRTFVKQFHAYCDSLGYVMLDQLGVADMDRFYASWKDGKRAKAKKLERLKSFVKFCLNREWLAKGRLKNNNSQVTGYLS